jgi:hypothetical protein
VGWALVDAEEVEQGTLSPAVPPTRLAAMKHESAATTPETRPLRAA